MVPRAVARPRPLGFTVSAAATPNRGSGVEISSHDAIVTQALDVMNEVPVLLGRGPGDVHVEHVQIAGQPAVRDSDTLDVATVRAETATVDRAEREARTIADSN